GRWKPLVVILAEVRIAYIASDADLAHEPRTHQREHHVLGAAVFDNRQRMDQEEERRVSPSRGRRLEREALRQSGPTTRDPSIEVPVVHSAERSSRPAIV